MFNKSVTEEIVRYQALGFSASETQTALKQENHIDISLNTIYKHRRSPIGQEIASELLRQQERSILKTDSSNPELAMRYRNELLKILIPQMTLILAKTETTNKTELSISKEAEEIIKFSRVFQDADPSTSGT